MLLYFFNIGKLRLECGTSGEGERRDNQDQGLGITQALITGILKCMLLFSCFLNKEDVKKNFFYGGCV